MSHAIQEDLVLPAVLHHGYVDAISDDMMTVAGWTGFSNDAPAPKLEAAGKDLKTLQASFGGERTEVTVATGIENRSFRLQLSRPVTALEILSGTVQVFVRRDLGETPIPYSGGVIKRAKRETLRALIQESPDEAQAMGLRSTDELDALRVNAEKVEAVGKSGNLTRVAFPVGLESRDRSAMLGHNGYLYLVGGSNNVLAQYNEPTSAEEEKALEGTAKAWAELVQNRRDELARRKTSFIQFIFPDKLTAMPDLAPVQTSGPTPLLGRINELLRDNPSYVDGVKVFDAWSGPAAPYQRNDSHCSPAGSLAAARAMLGALPGCGEGFLPDVRLTHTAFHDGDLTARFFGVPMWDEHSEPDPEQFAALTAAIKVRHSSQPGDRVMGSHTVLENPNAPIKKTVVAFGNSHFGWKPDRPAMLTWWFARLFTEFHFKWETDLDYSYVDEVNPDYVVCQSIERFIGRVPGK